MSLVAMETTAEDKYRVFATQSQDHFTRMACDGRGDKTWHIAERYGGDLS
jgi:hypothetical protein